MRPIKLLFICLLVMTLVLPTTAIAKDTDKAGKITAVSGKAEVKKGGGSKKFNAFKGMAITKGDTILTGKDGKVTMELDSDKVVTIGTNTTLTVSELVKSAKALGGKTSLSLLKGKVVIKIKKKLDGDSRFEIETPTAIMGVMGTEFVVEYEEDESYVAVFEGAVSTNHGQATRTIVNPDEQLRLDKSGQGQKETLNPNDLPLIGLEALLSHLLSTENASEAELNKIKQLIEKKKQEAAAEASEADKPQASQEIRYEDDTPAPVPTPSTAPKLNNDALISDVYKYMMDDRTFYLPFTNDIAFNTSDVEPRTDLQDIVSVEVYERGYLDIEPLTGEEEGSGEGTGEDCNRFEGFCPWGGLIEVSIENNLLKVTLSDSIAYGSELRFTVHGSKLKNAITGEIQKSEQKTPSEGLRFYSEPNPSSITFVKEERPGSEGTESPNYAEVIIPTLGYIIQDVLVEGASEELGNDDYQIEGEVNKKRLQINHSYLITLPVGHYKIKVSLNKEIVPLQGSGSGVEVYIDLNVVN